MTSAEADELLTLIGNTVAHAIRQLGDKNVGFVLTMQCKTTGNPRQGICSNMAVDRALALLSFTAEQVSERLPPAKG